MFRKRGRTPVGVKLGGPEEGGRRKGGGRRGENTDHHRPSGTLIDNETVARNTHVVHGLSEKVPESARDSHTKRGVGGTI